MVEKKICHIGVSDREKNSSFLKIFTVERDQNFDFSSTSEPRKENVPSLSYGFKTKFTLICLQNTER